MASVDSEKPLSLKITSILSSSLQWQTTSRTELEKPALFLEFS
jgi:hypothetical protein